MEEQHDRSDGPEASKWGWFLQSRLLRPHGFLPREAADRGTQLPAGIWELVLQPVRSKAGCRHLWHHVQPDVPLSPPRRVTRLRIWTPESRSEILNVDDLMYE